jgi:hypothetical protein
VVGLGSLRGVSAAAAPGLVEQAENIMSTQGPVLVSQILSGIGGSISSAPFSSQQRQALPTTTTTTTAAASSAPAPSVTVSRQLLRSFAELLFELVQNYPNQFREWAYLSTPFYICVRSLFIFITFFDTISVEPYLPNRGFLLHTLMPNKKQNS